MKTIRGTQLLIECRGRVKLLHFYYCSFSADLQEGLLRYFGGLFPSQHFESPKGLLCRFAVALNHFVSTSYYADHNNRRFDQPANLPPLWDLLYSRLAEHSTTYGVLGGLLVGVVSASATG